MINLNKVVVKILNYCAKNIVLPTLQRNINNNLFGSAPHGAQLEDSTVKSKRIEGYGSPSTALKASGKLVQGLKVSGNGVYSDGLSAKAQLALIKGTKHMKARNYLSPTQPAKGGKSLEEVCAERFNKIYGEAAFKNIDKLCKSIK